MKPLMPDSINASQPCFYPFAYSILEKMTKDCFVKDE